MSIFRIQIKNKISCVHSKIREIKKKYHDGWYYTIITVPVYKVFDMVFLFCMCWGIIAPGDFFAAKYQNMIDSEYICVVSGRQLYA